MGLTGYLSQRGEPKTVGAGSPLGNKNCIRIVNIDYVDGVAVHQIPGMVKVTFGPFQERKRGVGDVVARFIKSCEY